MTLVSIETNDATRGYVTSIGVLEQNLGRNFKIMIVVFKKVLYKLYLVILGIYATI